MTKNVRPAVEVVALIAQHWPQSEWLTALRTFLGESDLDANSLYINPETGDKSYGIAQVNMEGALMAERLKEFGLSHPEQLFDPATNIRCAFIVYQQQGWDAWGAFRHQTWTLYGRDAIAQKGLADYLATLKPTTGASVPYQIQHPVIWRGPVPNESGGFQRPAHGVVLHIMDGSLAGTDSWFHESQAQSSSDYGVGKDGTIYQWVDWTKDWKAWAEAAGNPYWVSIENEGHGGDSLTPAQLEANAQIVAHVFSLDSVPFVSTEDPNGHGLGWHGMGGNAWGGHFDCPGDPIKKQRPAILARARELVSQPQEEEDPMTGSVKPSDGTVIIALKPDRAGKILLSADGPSAVRLAYGPPGKPTISSHDVEQVPHFGQVAHSFTAGSVIAALRVYAPGDKLADGSAIAGATGNPVGYTVEY